MSQRLESPLSNDVISREYTQLLQGLSEAVVLVRGSDRTIAYLNSAAATLFEREPEELVGQVCHNFICPAARGQCPILDLGMTIDHGERDILVGGTPRLVVSSARLVELGGESYVLDTIHPFTQKGAARFDAEIRRSLEESQQRYRSLFSGASTPMLLIDPETGFIVDANRASERFYGYTRERFLELRITDINMLSEEEVFQEMDRAIVEKRNNFRFSHRLASGEVRSVEVYTGPIPVNGRSFLYSIVHDVTARVAAEKGLAEKTDELNQLFDNAPVAINVSSPDGVITRVNRATRELFGYREEEMIGRKIDDLILAPEQKEKGQGYTQRLHEEGEVISFKNTRYRKDGKPVEVSFIGFPLSNSSKGTGAFGMYFDISEWKKAEKDLERVNQALQGQNEALKTTWNQTIEVMAYTAELRDPYTAGHQKRVAVLSREIAREMALEDSLVEEVEKAALVHDLGKFEIPSEILCKPGKISKLEMALIQHHAKAGFDILRRIDLPWPLAEIVYQHHERMDGSGYPRGLKGDEILIQARIIAVADVVEAMSSHRPYRAALGVDEALKEIGAGSGTLYDAAVAAGCIQLFRDKGFAFPES